MRAAARVLLLALAVVVLLAGCIPSIEDSASPTSTQTTLRPLGTVAIPGLAVPTTDGVLEPLPTQPTTTLAPPPVLDREAEVAVRRCVLALDDDFMVLALTDRNPQGAIRALDLCSEATVQLEVEPESDFVVAMKEQVSNARQSIALVMLERRFRQEDAEILIDTLNGYVSRLTLQLRDVQRG